VENGMPARPSAALKAALKKRKLAVAISRSKGRKSIASLLRLTHRLYSRALLAAIQDRGVTTIVQWWILRTLWADDGLTQRELSDRIGLYESGIVAVLDSLTDKGLVVRLRNRSDRRKINVHLTKSGRALERDLLPLADRVNRSAEASLDARAIETLWATLTVLHANLEREVQTANGKTKTAKVEVVAGQFPRAGNRRRV
jgi:MarR family transcriptional regulator, organic hydroperoxide resistance regulator